MTTDWGYYGCDERKEAGRLGLWISRSEEDDDGSETCRTPRLLSNG